MLSCSIDSSLSKNVSVWSTEGTCWIKKPLLPKQDSTSIAARGGGGSFKRLKLYNSEEHVPIQSFVTTLIHSTFFLMTRTKLAFVGFVAAGNSMWHQVLDDLCLVVTDQSATTCDSSYAPTVPSTTPYYKALKSATPVLLRTTKYYSRRYYSSTTKY